MSDACCGHDAPGVGDPPEAERVWDVSELRAAAVAGVLLAGALVSWWVDAPRWVREPQMTPVLVDLVADYVAGRVDAQALAQASREDPAVRELMLDTRAFLRGAD